VQTKASSPPTEEEELKIWMPLIAAVSPHSDEHAIKAVHALRCSWREEPLDDFVAAATVAANTVDRYRF